MRRKTDDLKVPSIEPINLREWKAPEGSSHKGRLFTCGRPGRATHGRARVSIPRDTIDL